MKMYQIDMTQAMLYYIRYNFTEKIILEIYFMIQFDLI